MEADLPVRLEMQGISVLSSTLRGAVFSERLGTHTSAVRVATVGIGGTRTAVLVGPCAAMNECAPGRAPTQPREGPPMCGQLCTDTRFAVCLDALVTEVLFRICCN